MPAGMILESLVAVLLMVTIGYCFILNKRLSLLRNGQSELHEVVRILNEAADKARTGVEQLRRSSLSIAEDLTEKNRAARALADELSMIVESGNSLADRLAGGSSSNQTPARKPKPLEALSRIDEGFRKPANRPDHPQHDLENSRLDPVRKDSGAQSELRLALKAMR